MIPPDMSNGDIREALLTLALAMTTHVNGDNMHRVNALKSTMNSRLRYFFKMNPPIFLVHNVGEDPQEFLDGVYKVMSVMGVTCR